MDGRPDGAAETAAGGTSPAGSVPVAPNAGDRAGPASGARGARLWIAVVVVVVAVLIVLAVVLAGGLLRSGAKGSASPTFSGSHSAAQSAADGAGGGPWSPFLAVGLTTHSAFSALAGNLTGTAVSVSPSQWCRLMAGPTVPLGSLAAPGVGNVSSGNASVWVYMFANSTHFTRVVSVASGTATVLGLLGGAGCQHAAYAPLPSTGIIDSTAATSDANAAGGSAFLAAHPTANSTYVLTGTYEPQLSAIGPVWEIEYLTCALSGSGPLSGVAFQAAVSATTGDVLGSSSTVVTCPSTSAATALGSTLVLAPPFEGVAGPTYWYNFTIQAAAALTWANTSLSISSPTPTLSTAQATATVVDLVGSPLTTFAFASRTWSGASSTYISAAQVLCLSSPIGLSGATLVVYGIGNYSGWVLVSIP